MIVLVTGSRNFMDWKRVHRDLDALRDSLPAREVLFVRHGDCDSGADRFAKGWCYRQHNAGRFNVVEDPMPAEWQHEGCTHPQGVRNGQWYCKAAGPLRNQAMLDKGGVDHVLAYPLPHSPGTRDMMARAYKANIPVVNHGCDSYPQPMPIKEHQ